MDFGFNNFKWTTWPVWEAWKKDMFPLALGQQKYELYSYIVFKKLNDNQKFIDEFVQTFCHQMNTTFQPARLNHIVDSLKGNIVNEMPAHINLWSKSGGTTDYKSWEENIQKYYDFSDLRTPFMYEIIKNHYALNDTSLLVLENQKEKGTLFIYEVQIKPEVYSGYFYKDRTIEFSAIPRPGYSFKGWKVYQPDNSYTLIEANPFKYLPTGYNRIEAEYEEYREIVINEVLALNETGITDEFGEYEDWIELYNPNDFAVDVGGYYLTDDLNINKKYHIPATNPDITMIPAKGFLVFLADNQTEQGILHTNFKLTSDGEEVGLSRTFGPAVHFIDTLTFPPLEANTSYGCTTDGAATFTTFETPTPGAANNPNGTGISGAGLADFNVTVYPNPVRDELHIELQNPGHRILTLKISLYDIYGRLIHESETRNPHTSDRINLSMTHLDEGIYLLRVQADNQSKTVKIIKASTQ
jgi:hypothetical protein